MFICLLYALFRGVYTIWVHVHTKHLYFNIIEYLINILSSGWDGEKNASTLTLFGQCCFFALAQKLKHCLYISSHFARFSLGLFAFLFGFPLWWNGMIEPLGFIFVSANKSKYFASECERVRALTVGVAIYFLSLCVQSQWDVMWCICFSMLSLLLLLPPSEHACAIEPFFFLVRIFWNWLYRHTKAYCKHSGWMIIY